MHDEENGWDEERAELWPNPTPGLEEE